MFKNYLLACSNYYPHSFGGTEVYVAAHAQFIREKGNKVCIITATPSEYYTSDNTIYTDDILKVCTYTHDGILVFGICYRTKIDTEFIYSKYKHEYTNSWENFIKRQIEFSNLDVLHIQSFTVTIGLNLFNAIIKNNKNLKVITNYHTAISCPKGTLMYNNSLAQCNITANVTNCNSCLTQTQNQLPNFLVKGINLLKLRHPKLPSIFKTKYLVDLDIHSFDQLKKITDEWWCYSNGIKNILTLNGIAKRNVNMFRHGISNLFFNKTINIEKSCNETIYLYSGRLAKIKGITTLLKAWLELPEQNTKALWLTAHSKSEDAEISELIKYCYLRKDIFFLGEQTQEELASLYKKAHFVIIPSECFEIGPLVFHEAIASKCNVICSDIGGCKELGDYYRPNAKQFRAGNSKELRDVILNMDYKFEELDSAIPIDMDKHFNSI